jgi:hypothetical protein
MYAILVMKHFLVTLLVDEHGNVRNFGNQTLHHTTLHIW